MADPMLQDKLSEREDKVRLIESVIGAARDAGRDLSDQDKEVITAARSRVDAIDAQVEYLSLELEQSEETRARLARLSPGSVRAPVRPYANVGEVLWDALHRSTDPEARERWDRTMVRAAQHMGTVAADTTATAGDLAGVVVDPVVGPVINFNDTSRPFLAAIGTQRVAAYDFRRPYLNDAGLASPAIVQTTQKAELASTAFTVASDTIEYTTLGSYLNVSQQLLSFQPGSLQIIINELAARVARASEKAAVTEMANSTSKVTLATTATDPSVVLAAIWDGMAKVYAETGMPATWIAGGPTGTARLGKLVDSAGRPIFPTLGPANAPGTAGAGDVSSVAGLRYIQTYGITDLNYWVGNSGSIEAYEYPFPILDQVEPSVLGRQVAVAAAYAFYRPRSATGDDGAVHLAP